MLSDEKLARLNELAKLAKERELSVEESAEREALRTEYRGKAKAHLTEHLHTITVVDEKGNDVTPEPLKKSKENRKRN